MEKIDMSKIVPGKSYLVVVENKRGYRHASVAEYWPKYTKEDEGDWDDDAREDLDYDEEKDTFYWPEGWYEMCYESDINYIIHGTVTYYQEIVYPEKEQ